MSRIVKVPSLSPGNTAADQDSLTQNIISPTAQSVNPQTVIAPVAPQQAPQEQLPQEARSQPIPAPQTLIQPQEQSEPISRRVTLPPIGGFDSSGRTERQKSGFQISVPARESNGVQKLRDQRIKESEDRSLFAKVFERPISGTFTFLGALINSENMSDIPEIMNEVLDGTALEDNSRILEKGLKGFGAIFTIPLNAVTGASGAEDVFSQEAIDRANEAAMQTFADTFSIDDYLIYDAIQKDPKILNKPEELQKIRRDFTEGGYDRFVREIKEGRQVSDAKIASFAITSATAHVAEFVLGGGGISKSAQFVIKTTTGAGKLSLGTLRILYKAPIKTKDAIKGVLTIVRGGSQKQGMVTTVIKMNPAAVHQMKTLVSSRNLHGAKLEIFKTEIAGLVKQLDEVRNTPNIRPDVAEELSKRLKAFQTKESVIANTAKELDNEILQKFGVDQKVLNEMMDFSDMYKATSKQIRQNVKNLQKKTGPIVKQDLEEASVLARNTSKHVKNLNKEQGIKFKSDFGIVPERVAQLRGAWYDLLAVAKGRLNIKDIGPAAQSLFIKGRGIKIGIKSDPVLISVQKIIQNLHPDKRAEALKDLFTKAFKDKAKFSITQLDEMTATLKKMSGENDDIATQINTKVSEAIAAATNRVTAAEQGAIDQAIQIRGGLERLRQVSIEKFGKDVTQLSKKQIRELAKPLDDDLDELISVRDLIVKENTSDLRHMKATLKKVFGIDIKKFDRADMMNRSREFELLKRSANNLGKKAEVEGGIVKQLHKDFMREYGITPQQFQQVEQFAADIHKTPWMQRFSPEFVNKLDYFATLTGGVKYRQFRNLVKGAPAKIAVPSPKFLKTQLIGDLVKTLRSHEARLRGIGGSADEISERILRRDEESRRAAGMWKEEIRDSVKGLSDDEIKAMRIAMMNDKTPEKMMASISGFGSRIRPGVVAEAAVKNRDLLDEIIIVADDVGVNISGIREEYFPIIHKYTDMFTNERTREAFINKMMKEGVEMSQKEFDFLLASNQVNTGDVSALAAYASDFADLMTDLTKRSSGTVRHTFQTREQASKILEGMGIARGSRASKNLTLSRHGEGLPGAVLDPLETLNTYVERAANTINDQVWFAGAKGAKQDQTIRELIGKLPREADREEVASIFNDIVNAPKPLLKQKTMRAASTIRALNTPKLAFMAINNSAQGFLGTLWATDFAIASKAFRNAFTAKGKEFARRNGAVFDNMEMQMANESGVNSALSSADRIKTWQKRFLKWNGATITERHNRTTASLGGMYQVEHIASKVRQGAALSRKEERLIRELVFDKPADFISNIKTGLYDSNPDKWNNVLQIAGQRLARRSQLDPTGLFTREFTNSPLGSIWLQYKSFALNHARFMWQQTNPKRFIDEVILDPNLTKIEKGKAFSEYLNKLLAYQVSGELIGDIRTGIINLWRDDKIERPEDWERVVQNFMYVGGLGIVTDIANIAINGNKYQAMGQVLGPSGSDLATLWAGNMSEKSSVFIEKLPIPVLNKSLADMAQGK